mgnify:CR=1 FL=1
MQLFNHLKLLKQGDVVCLDLKEVESANLASTSQPNLQPRVDGNQQNPQITQDVGTDIILIGKKIRMEVIGKDSLPEDL